LARQLSGRAPKSHNSYANSIYYRKLTHQITHLLTLNPRDFPGNLGITIVQPQDLPKF